MGQDLCGPQWDLDAVRRANPLGVHMGLVTVQWDQPIISQHYAITTLQYFTVLEDNYIQGPPDFLILQIILDYYRFIDFFQICNRDFYGFLGTQGPNKNL